MEDKKDIKNEKLKIPKEEYEVYYSNGKKMSKQLIERMYYESLGVHEVKEDI
jgi:hypothetical protein